MNQVAVKEVIARFDQEANLPVIFKADEIPTNTVPAYYEGKGWVDVPMDKYHTTERLSANDTKLIVDNFKQQMGIPEVIVRHRMKYTKDVSKVADRFAVTNETIAQAPTGQKEVLQIVQERQKRKYNKRSEVAKQRVALDEAASAVANLKHIPDDAPQSEKAKAIEELSKKIAAIISSAI